MKFLVPIVYTVTGYVEVRVTNCDDYRDACAKALDGAVIDVRDIKRAHAAYEVFPREADPASEFPSEVK